MRKLGFERLENRRLLAADLGAELAQCDFAPVVEQYEVATPEVESQQDFAIDFSDESAQSDFAQPDVRSLDLSDGADGFYGTISAENPQERFQFTAAENGSVDVVIASSFGDGDTVLEIRNQAGELVAATATDNLSGFQSLKFDVRADTEYELIIASDGNGSGDFQMTASFEVEPEVEQMVDLHANEAGLESTELTITDNQAEMHGQLETAGDVDTFVFQSECDGEAVLYLGELDVDNQTELNVAILDADSEVVIEGSTNEVVKLSFDVVADAQYFVVVSAQEDQTGEYGMMLKLTHDQAEMDVATETDAEIDAVSETSSDAATNPDLDSEADCETDADADSTGNADAESDVDAEIDPGSEAAEPTEEDPTCDADLSTDVDAETDADIDADADSDVGAEIDNGQEATDPAEEDATCDADLSTDVDDETDVDIDADADSDDGEEVDPGSEATDDMEADPNCDADLPTDSESDSGADVQQDPDAGTDVANEDGGATDPGCEIPDVDPDSGNDTDAAADPGSESNMESDASVDPGTDSESIVDDHDNEVGVDATELPYNKGMMQADGELETGQDRDAFRFVAGLNGDIALQMRTKSLDYVGASQVSVFSGAGDLIVQGVSNEQLGLRFDTEAGAEYQILVESLNETPSIYELTMTVQPAMQVEESLNAVEETHEIDLETPVNQDLANVADEQVCDAEAISVDEVYNRLGLNDLESSIRDLAFELDNFLSDAMQLS